jgi:sigma54-dependent transcription regulator
VNVSYPPFFSERCLSGHDNIKRDGPERQRVMTLDPHEFIRRFLLHVQLAFVVETCRSSRSLSDAGRKLFAASREKRASTNDAGRLRKYLARFGITWELVIS